MRYTYTDLQNDFLDNIGQTGSTDANLIAFFNRKLSFRYQTALAFFTNPLTQVTKTASTVINQQDYHKPVGIVDIEAATVTVGSIAYPLVVVDSQLTWDQINETLISTTAIPKFIFPKRDSFGIWPTPQGVYTITLNSHIRDRSLTQADVTAGTITATLNSQTITNSGSNFTTSMAGRWFVLTNGGVASDYWYRISSATTTTLTLETSFEGTTGSGLNYKVGESPEIPEEGHALLSIGCSADYWAARGDKDKATWWDNMYWTGSPADSDRTREKVGGWLGIQGRYAGRSNGVLVRHHKFTPADNDKLWATTIS